MTLKLFSSRLMLAVLFVIAIGRVAHADDWACTQYDWGMYCVEVHPCDWAGHPFISLIEWWNGECS